MNQENLCKLLGIAWVLGRLWSPQMPMWEMQSLGRESSPLAVAGAAGSGLRDGPFPRAKGTPCSCGTRLRALKSSCSHSEAEMALNHLKSIQRPEMGRVRAREPGGAEKLFPAVSLSMADVIQRGFVPLSRDILLFCSLSRLWGTPMLVKSLEHSNWMAANFLSAAYLIKCRKLWLQLFLRSPRTPNLWQRLPRSSTVAIQ